MLAGSVSAFTTVPLRLTSLDGFLALCPSADHRRRSITWLARCVTELDHLRAAMTPIERAGRKPKDLTLEQRRLLDTWGYPHVFEHFRFHITLTKRLTDAERLAVQSRLEEATCPYCIQPFRVDAIAVFGDPGGGRPFSLVQRFPFLPAAEAA